MALKAVLLMVAPSVASADGGSFYGLLRERDLTPFGFLRLDMRPAHAVTIEKGTWALEVGMGYQNTWALSREVEKYLTSLEPRGRHELGPADLEAIRALPGENYLVDLEAAAVDVTFHYKLAPDWTSYFIASAVSYQGGFLDDTIEQFHRTFGFSTFGRPATARNDVNIIYDLKSAKVARFGAPTDGGFMDPIVGLRYTGWRLPAPWGLAVEAAAKMPIAGRRMLLSSGRVDYGIQASLQRRGAHHAIYANLSAVYYGGAQWPVPQESQVIPTAILGYERGLTPRTNINLQAYVSKSVYTHDDTDLDELTRLKYQYSIGVRHRVQRLIFTLGVTENFQNVNNTPDIGFQLGVAYVPHPVNGR